MLIKFNSTQSFENETMTINKLIDKIKHYLKDKNADNIEVDRNTIYFNNTPWK